MDKKYVIVRHKHGRYNYNNHGNNNDHGNNTWYTWILSEYSNPDNQGRFQCVRIIADFGNIAYKRNYQYAKIFKKVLESI